MAVEELCVKAPAERVRTQEGRRCGERSNDDQVINKKHSAACRRKARVSTSAQSSAHRLRAASCSIPSGSSRKRSGSRWILEEVTRDGTPGARQPIWKTTPRGGGDGSPRKKQQAPLTLAISPISPLRLHQRCTLHTELLSYTTTLLCSLVYSSSPSVFFSSCLMKAPLHHFQVRAGFASIVRFRGQGSRGLLWPSKGRHLDDSTWRRMSLVEVTARSPA